METLETVYGLLCLATLIILGYYMITSRTQALANMQERLNMADSPPVRSNAEAIEDAKRFFESFDGKAYRKYGNHVVSDNALPKLVEMQAIKSISVMTFAVLLFGGAGIWAVGSDGVIFNAIPIPGILLAIICFALMLLCANVIARVWLYREAKLTLGHDTMTLQVEGNVYQLNYNNYELLIQPINKYFDFQLMSKYPAATQFQKILMMFPRKQIIPILVAKALEYGKLHSSIGGEVS